MESFSEVRDLLESPPKASVAKTRASLKRVPFEARGSQSEMNTCIRLGWLSLVLKFPTNLLDASFLKCYPL